MDSLISGKPLEQGKVVRIALDNDFNGKADQWQSLQPSGAISLIESDTNGDGETDQWHYYENGQVERVDIDKDGGWHT